MPTISISSREDSNNRFMARSPARAEFGLPQRLIFLGALEIGLDPNCVLTNPKLTCILDMAAHAWRSDCVNTISLLHNVNQNPKSLFCYQIQRYNLSCIQSNLK